MQRKFFREQDRGYDKKQVENYIADLIKTYQRAYNEYLDISDKYAVISELRRNEMLKRRRKFKKKPKTLLNFPGGEHHDRNIIQRTKERL